MAAGRIIFPGMMPARDANGDIIPSAKAYVYENESTTLAAFYTTNALSVALANPVEADASGVWPAMWADTTDEFTVALTDEDGAPVLAPWDGLSASIDATLASSDLAESAQAAAEAAEVAAEAAQVAAEAAAAQAEATAAEVSGTPYSATSITSLTVGTGPKTLTLEQTGRLFTVGQTLVIARTSAPGTQMTGVLTAFNSETGVMTVESAATAGAGTHTDWTVALSSSGGVLSMAGESGVVTAEEAKTALAITTADITDLATYTAARNGFAIAVAVALGD